MHGVALAHPASPPRADAPTGPARRAALAGRR